MATSNTDSLVLFALSAKNHRAERVLSHPENRHLISTRADGQLTFDIGFPLRGQSPTTLATLGRGTNADIFVEGSNISRVQCSFEVDLDTGIVMFYDRSHGSTSQVFGKDATPFEFGRPRKVVVQESLNTIIGMGGERCDLFLFELDWRHEPSGTTHAIKRYGAFPGTRKQHPRITRTVDEAPTELPSHRETRLHTPGSLVLKIRYIKIGKIGSGSFGEVHKAIDVDSGKVMAVKILRRPQDLSRRHVWKETVALSLKREIEILSGISHIFMGLKEGTLESLIGNGADATTVADNAFPHMLRALDCIAFKDIIHRDVKPENILYVLNASGEYQFQLGDFGCCNRAVEAATISGTPMFMAPEVHKGERQSCKADIWSLFVTMLWTLDVNGFRHTHFKSMEQVWTAVSCALSSTALSRLSEMAVVNPLQRASAAQMLVKLFHGKGLSTPLKQVPALHSNSVVAADDDSKAMVRNPPDLAARDAIHHKQVRERLDPAGLQRKAPMDVAHVRKRRTPVQMKLAKVGHTKC
ncbi:hypothetical protein FOPE_01142 [Fonsecaea pedrosoi]|nr:hypothetical protein FOPE_01142 [Fonsecaea pedrosoi]